MYNPLLLITRTWILEKSFGEKRISDVLTAFIKSDFSLVCKTLEKMKNCLLLSERMEFLSAGTFLLFSFLRSCTLTHLVYWRYL